jgi:hypothetical protein
MFYSNITNFILYRMLKKSFGVKPTYDISIENATKTIKRLYYYSVTVFLLSTRAIQLRKYEQIFN